MITLALTHYNRFDMILEAIEQVKDDPRIAEIVISDDCSDDGSYQALRDKFLWSHKVSLYRNERNLDCYGNKAKAVELANNPWVILFDSDNVISPEYLDALEKVQPWEKDVAYLPTFAQPEFDYREFEGLVVTRRNVSSYMENETFRTALNTANHFMYRDEYLRAWDSNAVPHTSDSIYMNFLWLQAGNKIMFVPGLHYFHRLHDGSHFVLNDHKTGEFKATVETLLKMLR